MRNSENADLNALRPSLKGLATSIPSRQTDGPYWPMYILANFPAPACAWSSAASGIAESTSAGAFWYPYVVGITAFGVSSPAYPARTEEVPISITRADTSSVYLGMSVARVRGMVGRASAVIDHRVLVEAGRSLCHATVTPFSKIFCLDISTNGCSGPETKEQEEKGSFAGC